MDINFELYKVFYYAAKLQSFSNAAQTLYITQSAVSQAIKNLENKTGFQLFIRKNRQAILTREGELLYKHIEQAFNFIKAAEVKIVELQNMEIGEVRIGVGDTICKYFIIPYLKRFNFLYPKIKIQVINRTSSQIVKILKNGLIDVGIITLSTSKENILFMQQGNLKQFEYEDTLFEQFISVKDIFVASSKFSFLKEKSLGLSELSEYPLLMLQRDSATRSNIEFLLKSWQIELKPEIELESIDLLIEFAKIGLGIAHVLKESASEAISKGELFEVSIKESFPERKLGIITAKDVPLSRSASEFKNLLIS